MGRGPELVCMGACFTANIAAAAGAGPAGAWDTVCWVPFVAAGLLAVLPGWGEEGGWGCAPCELGAGGEIEPGVGGLTAWGEPGL